MAIFTKADSKPTPSSQKSSNGVTIIAPGNHIAGQFTIAGALHVDGQIEGEVCSEGLIEVGRQGEMTGVIRSITMQVAGVVKANICCDKLTVLPGGEVHGQLKCSDLVVESGGQFYGERKPQEMQQQGLLEAELVVDEKSSLAADTVPD